MLFAQASRHSAKVILPINDVALSRHTPEPAFYCVHSVSGVAGKDFLELAQRVEPDVRFYGIQAPPKQMQDATFGSSIEAVATHYADALVKFQPEGPLMLGGYCAGTVIALAMANILRARGRQVGPLLAINGVPENARGSLRGWSLRYWTELVRNLPNWATNADLVRSRSFRLLAASLMKNASALSKAAIGLKRAQTLDGGFAMDGLMDLSIYRPEHRLFINRLANALFAYVPTPFNEEVVIYEANTTPLLYLPQIGRRWQTFAPKTKIVSVVGTHLGIMREPYVSDLARDMRQRICEFFSLAMTAPAERIQGQDLSSRERDFPQQSRPNN